jgi:serine/threonine protein kinase
VLVAFDQLMNSTLTSHTYAHGCRALPEAREGWEPSPDGNVAVMSDGGLGGVFVATPDAHSMQTWIDAIRMSLESGQYERQKVLGSGQFGCVYMAKDRVDEGTTYVLKEVNYVKQKDQTPDRARNLALSEAYCLQKLNHPNIVQVGSCDYSCV